MEIQYVIINFLILVAIVAVAGRKMILSIFRTRRERIENEIREAEEIEKTPLPTFEEVSLSVPEKTLCVPLYTMYSIPTPPLISF